MIISISCTYKSTAFQNTLRNQLVAPHSKIHAASNTFEEGGGRKVYKDDKCSPKGRTSVPHLTEMFSYAIKCIVIITLMGLIHLPYYTSAIKDYQKRELNPTLVGIMKGRMFFIIIINLTNPASSSSSLSFFTHSVNFQIIHLQNVHQKLLVLVHIVQKLTLVKAYVIVENRKKNNYVIQVPTPVNLNQVRRQR